VSVSDLAIVAALVFAWGTLSARLERFDVTAPISFVVAGLLLTHGPLAFLGVAPSRELIKELAESTLALVLFSDASRVGLHELRTEAGLYLRLLGAALPLTIGLGTLLALALVSGASAGGSGACGCMARPGNDRPGGLVRSTRPGVGGTRPPCAGGTGQFRCWSRRCRHHDHRVAQRHRTRCHGRSAGQPIRKGACPVDRGTSRRRNTRHTRMQAHPPESSPAQTTREALMSVVSSGMKPTRHRRADRNSPGEG